MRRTRIRARLSDISRPPILRARFACRHLPRARATFCPRSLPLARFTGVDFYELDSLLTEDEIQIRDHVRGWVEERFLPVIEDAYDEA